ncbi:major facilitator superfamily domain-containing protein 12-like [Onthophagus taurus]|uniref:major facilitator superfamily domain-containing protein 12-like n=1 Tax=Onthophagus taurus TaxID=166361 RepID=UPI000C20941A|nr:major facilitator superfamily domain-containing protein 12-like [Onthophagus taurus]
MDEHTPLIISNEYTEIYRRLPFKLQVAYGIGHVLNDVCASMWFTYLLVFFNLVLKFTSAQAGLILLVGQVADAIATPFVGYHSDQPDNFWFCCCGRRKAWHFFGTICVIATFPFIFLPCLNCEHSSTEAQLFYYSLFVIIFQFGWAAVQISHLSLIPELTPNEHDRTKLTAVRYGFTVFSNVLVYLITWYYLHIGTGSNSQIGPDDAPKFQNVVIYGMGVGITCSILFHIFVKEENGYTGNNVRGGVPRSSISDLLCSMKLYQVAVVYMSTRLFVNLSQIFIPLYLHESLNMAASALALIPLIMFIGSFLTTFIIEFMNRTIGRRISYISGGIIGIVGCAMVRFRYGEDFINYDIYVVAILFGAANSIILVTSLGITVDLIGDKSGSVAFVYGVMSFCDKLANGIAVVIIQDFHTDASSSQYYRDIVSYVCGGSALLGILGVLSLKRMRESIAQNVPNYNSINAEANNSTSSS